MYYIYTHYLYFMYVYTTNTYTYTFLDMYMYIYIYTHTRSHQSCLLLCLLFILRCANTETKSAKLSESPLGFPVTPHKVLHHFVVFDLNEEAPKRNIVGARICRCPGPLRQGPNRVLGAHYTIILIRSPPK